MPNTVSIGDLYEEYWEERIEKILTRGLELERGRDLKNNDFDPYEVSVVQIGNEILVKSYGYRKYIPMKNTFLDNLTGDSWEARVRRAKEEAFMAAYQGHKDKENLEYRVNKLK